LPLQFLQLRFERETRFAVDDEDAEIFSVGGVFMKGGLD